MFSMNSKSIILLSMNIGDVLWFVGPKYYLCVWSKVFFYNSINQNYKSENYYGAFIYQMSQLRVCARWRIIDFLFNFCKTCFKIRLLFQVEYIKAKSFKSKKMHKIWAGLWWIIFPLKFRVRTQILANFKIPLFSFLFSSEYCSVLLHMNN